MKLLLDQSNDAIYVIDSETAGYIDFNTNTAQADDPSAIYFNPAGLTQLQGNNVMLGVTYVKENGGTFDGYTPVDNSAKFKSETQKDLNFFIPNMYYTHTTKDGWIAYGVGIFAPFGLGQEYENKNTSIFRNQITKIDLQTIVVNPNTGLQNQRGGFGRLRGRLHVREGGIRQDPGPAWGRGPVQGEP